MAIKFANLASTTLASGITSTATTLTVGSAANFPTLSSGDYFYGSLGEGTGSEIVKVTAISGSDFTITRGQDGTTAQAWDSGTSFALRVVAAALDDLATAADTESVSKTGDTMTGNLTVPQINLNSASYDNRQIGMDSNGFFIFNAADSRYDLKISDSGVATFGGNATFAGELDVNLSAAGKYFEGGSGNVRRLSITSGTNVSAHAKHTFDIASSNGQYVFQTNSADRLTLDSSGGTFTGDVTADKYIMAGGSQIGQDYAYLKSASTTTASLTLRKDSTGADSVDFLQLRSDGNGLIGKIEGDGDISFAGATFSGNVDVGGSITKTGSMIIDSSVDISLDADDSGHVRFKDGGTQYASIYKSGSNAVLDTTGNFTINVPGEIILDSDAEFVRIYHDGNWVGGFQLTNNDFIIRSAVQDKDIIFKGYDGTSLITSLRLDHSNAGRAYFSAGASFNGNINANDNQKLILGTHDDFQIFHDGSNSYIQSATGNFNITTAGGNEFALTAVNDGAVTLFHNGSAKIATTSSGIDVSGNAAFSNRVTITNGTTNGASTIGGASDELLLDTSTDTGMTIRSGATGDGVISFASPTDHNVGQVYYRHSDNSLNFKSNDVVAMTINSSQQVGISTTDPKFHLQAGNGGLDSRGTGSGIAIRNNLYYDGGDKYLTGSGAASTIWFDGSGNIRFYNTATSSTGATNAITNLQQVFHIGSGGKIGIGTASPSSYDSRANTLVVGGSGDTGITIFSGASNDARLQFAPSGDSGLNNGLIGYDNSNDRMTFATAGTDRMYISSVGDVYFPIATNAMGKFADNISEVGSGNFALQISNTAESALKPFGIRAEDIRFATGSSERLRLYNDGSAKFFKNVGIVKNPVSTVSLSVAAQSTSTSSYGLEITNASSETRFLVDGVGNSWFYKTNNAVGMRWDAVNSRLGVNISSPTDTLDVRGNARIGDGVSAEQDIYFAAGSGAWQVGTNASGNGTSNNQFYIYDSAYRFTVQKGTGHVGIGTNSPAAELHLKDTGGLSRIRLEGTAASADNFEFGQGTTGVTNGGFEIRDVDAGATRLVIDSSGNLLVGTTSATAYNNSSDVYGFNVYANGQIASSVNGAQAAYFNRQNSDGIIADFRKDGSTVGRIGTTSGRLYIGSGDVGLRFAGDLDFIAPWDASSNAARDGAIALGNTNNRFADFWLKNGGAVFFGDGSHFIVGGASYGGGDLKIRASDDLNLNARWVRYHDDVGSAGEYARIAYNGSWINSNLTINALQIGTNSSNVTVLNSSRQLQNVTLISGSSGARFATNAWHEDASGQQRFYFLANSHLYFKTGGSYIFRSSSDTGLATLSNYGGINLRSGNDSTLGEFDALGVAGNVVLTSSRGLKNITSLGINGTAGTTYPIYASSAQRYIMALRNTAADANYPWFAHDTASSMSRLTVHFNGAGDQFYVYENGTVQANGSFQAPGFYDTNDSNYFLDPASTGTSGEFRRFVQIGDSSTYGSNSGGWGARLNVTDDVHARIDVGQDDNNMLSYWYAHTGHSDIKFGTSSAHNVSFQRGGVTQLYVDNGFAGANNQFRTPITYDANNTSWYSDINGDSRMARLLVGDGSNYIRIGDESEGANSSYARIRTNNMGDLFLDQKDGRNLYLSWWTGGSARVFSEAGAQFPVYYDRNNTSFYLNASDSGTSGAFAGQLQLGPNSSSRKLRLGGNGGQQDMSTISVSNGNLHLDAQSGYGIHLSWYNTSDVIIGGALQAVVYYDRNNTGYYADPNGNSNFYRIYSSQLAITAGDGQGIGFWGGIGGDSYSIYMSSTGNSTYGGRVNNETTSDYNMYFKMSGGTNRGFVFRNGSDNVAGIDASGNFRAEGNVIAYASSDRKLKSSITPIENALQKVCSLRGYEFLWNDRQTIYPAGTPDIGVIAQEVIEQFPTAVAERTTAEGDTHLGVNYERLVPALIEAIRELKDEIDSLKEKLK